MRRLPKPPALERTPLKPGRPKGGSNKKQPPADAATVIRELAASGYNQRSLAWRLGASQEVFRRWLDENPNLQQAWDEGRETEHNKLFTALFDQAMKGNIVASIFLLKCRHGYREGDQSDIANRVSITYNLPGAAPLDAFKGRTIVQETKAITVEPKE